MENNSCPLLKGGLWRQKERFYVKKTTRRSGITRRQALYASAAGAAFAAAAGIGPRWLKSGDAWAADLAPGMTGGPTGFAGAERYQYDDTMSEGWAVAGARKLKAESKAPETLRIRMADGAIGHFTSPWPADGPTLQSIWERETGIKIEFISVSPQEQFNKVIQDVTTGSNAYDVYTFVYAAMGDLSEANGIVPSGEWMEKHGADFADPERGMPMPESYNMLYKCDGEPMSVCYYGDAQVWVYRKDLTEDPIHKAAFSDKYGWEPGPPRTWAEADQLAEYYTLSRQ